MICDLIKLGKRLPPNRLAPLPPEGRDKKREKEFGSVIISLQSEEETGSLPLNRFMREKESPLLSSKEGNEICRWIRVCYYRVCLIEKSEEIV